MVNRLREPIQCNDPNVAGAPSSRADLQAPDQLKAEAKIALLSDFAGRLAEPLRHLL